jgi:hypothetical protein
VPPSEYAARAGIAAMMWFVATLASADLAIDLLHTVAAALPRWQKGFGPLQERIQAGESGVGKWFRRAIDILWLAVAAAMPVMVFWPGRESDPIVRAIWALAPLALFAWLIYLLRLPQNRDVNSYPR